MSRLGNAIALALMLLQGGQQFENHLLEYAAIVGQRLEGDRRRDFTERGVLLHIDKMQHEQRLCHKKCGQGDGRLTPPVGL